MAAVRKKTTTIISSVTDTNLIRFRIGSKKIALPRSITWPVVVFCGSMLASVFLFPYTSTVQSFHLPKKGDVSTETIIAPLTFDIMKSAEELEKDRKDARGQVLEVFDRHKDTEKAIRKRLSELRVAIKTLNNPKMSDSLKLKIRSRLKKELSENTIDAIHQRPYLLDDAVFQVDKLLETGIINLMLVPDKQGLAEIKQQYNVRVESYLIYDKTFITLRADSNEITLKHADLPVKEQALEIITRTLKVERLVDQDGLNSIYEILDVFLKPNILHNREETEKRVIRAVRSVLATKGKVIKDTEIVRKHQEVTADIVEKLKSLHEAIASKQHGQETSRVLRTNFGRILLIILILFLVGFYIIRYHGYRFKDPKHLIALACIVILQIALIRLSLFIAPKIFEAGAGVSTLVPEFIIPTAVASILIAILFDFQISIIVTLFISLFFAISLSFNQSFFIYSILGGFIGGFSTQKIRYRWDFIKAIPPMIAIYAVYIFAWSLINYKFSFMALFQNAGLGAVNSIATIFVAMMAVAFFEYLFDITTSMTLIELSDMNNPLLKRLSIEAAGTYNHSVLVANLAESAAEKVNANPLLARVASYYHDVGKISKPNYFVENQKMEKNIHEKLTPTMSALIISSHVKEGLELARKYKMPSVIRQAISEHHGTSTVSFFYEKARELDPHNQVDEKEFSYPGPRPQTKENAIIMLADSVEAASRSLSASSPKMLRNLVKKIIHDKFASSQLDECNLSFQDLDKIIEGFMPVLHGIFHTRIEYPSTKAGDV